MTTGLRWPLSVPVLSDGVVTLRAATPADVEAMWEMTQDPDMQRWTAVPIPNTREMSAQFALEIGAQGWDEGLGRFWVLEAPDDDGTPRFAGNVDVRGGPVADVGYSLHPWARGRGFMARAVRLAVDHVLTEGGIEAVHWRAHVGNEASLRVAHACGFELLGTTPALLHERDRAIDAWTAVIRFGDAPTPRTRWAQAPVLTTERLRLRPLADHDLHRIVEACTDPETRHWLNTLPSPYTAVTARAYLDRCTWQAATGTVLTWGVADASTDALVSVLSLMHLDGPNPGTAEVGYWTHPDARGRGLTTEAVTAAAAWALSPAEPSGAGLGLQRLSLLAAGGNAGSNRVAEKVGFRRIGLERQAELLGDGTVDDLVSYDLLADERPPSPAAG